jgi:OmpA-OmpF porin, OOP family
LPGFLEVGYCLAAEAILSTGERPGAAMIRRLLVLVIRQSRSASQVPASSSFPSTAGSFDDSRKFAVNGADAPRSPATGMAGGSRTLSRPLISCKCAARLYHSALPPALPDDDWEVVAMKNSLGLRRFGRRFAAAAFVVTVLASAPAFAQDVLPQAWRLDPAQSSFVFTSVKKGNVVENSKFSSFFGEISKTGDAQVAIDLESVDTGVDLRNVRMRFLFFETYKFPVASIRAKVDPAKLAALSESGRVHTSLEVTLDLHGVQQKFAVPVTVTLIKDDLVSVASRAPVIVKVDTFGLLPGLEKLQEAVNVVIVPATTVSFDMVFRAEGGVPVVTAAVQTSGALESKGELTVDECTTRFDVLSKTRAIYFESGSARIDRQSDDLLDTVAEIARRCPTLRIEIAGHTDPDGGPNYNLRLSERRAKAVFDYLTGHEVPGDRLAARGYGDTQPVAGNGTPADKAKNRRIEFRVGA